MDVAGTSDISDAENSHRAILNHTALVRQKRSSSWLRDAAVLHVALVVVCPRLVQISHGVLKTLLTPMNGNLVRICRCWRPGSVESLSHSFFFDVANRVADAKGKKEADEGSERGESEVNVVAREVRKLPTSPFAVSLLGRQLVTAGSTRWRCAPTCTAAARQPR